MSTMKVTGQLAGIGLSVLLTSCACGPFTPPLSFPAPPTIITATIPVGAQAASVTKFDAELRNIVGKSNLEHAYIGCTNGPTPTDVCSLQLTYKASEPVIYTFIRELNPRSCRFMRAWDKTQKQVADSKLEIHIALDKTGPDCGAAPCTPAAWCKSCASCTKSYPQCVACP